MSPRLETRRYQRTFVLKVTSPAEALQQQSVSGRIEHVASGLSSPFTSIQDLERFVMWVLAQDERTQRERAWGEDSWE